jgi:hypothetical protein
MKKTATAGVHLLPNPFNNSLQLESGLDATTVFDVTIYDMPGRELIGCTGTKATVNNTLVQQAATWPTGSYVALIRSAGKQFVIKIVKAGH